MTNKSGNLQLDRISPPYSQQPRGYKFTWRSTDGSLEYNGEVMCDSLKEAGAAAWKLIEEGLQGKEPGAMEIKYTDVVTEGVRGGQRVSLSKLVGKKIADVHGYLANPYGGEGLKLTHIVFEDGTYLRVEGEHDFPYVVGDQPNFNEGTLLRLEKEQDEHYT